MQKRPYDAWDMAGQTTPWVKLLAVAVIILLVVLFVCNVPPP